MFLILLVANAAFFLAVNLLLAPLLRFIRFISGRGIATALGQIRSISIIVPAYNEEKNIGKKIETISNALRRVNLEAEVIIGSDGSTDRTAEVATALLKEMNNPNWKLFEFENEGKCQTLNKLVSRARGEVIISTDADIPVPENAFDLVVRTFQSNNKLGCLSCIPCFAGLNIGSQKSYWSIEDRIRCSESDLGRLIVVTGMLYAYKRELFEQIPKGVMADDLWIPLTVLLKGYDSVQVDELLVPYEKTDEETEIMRRQRVIVGGMDVVRRLWPRLVKSPSLISLVIFHKVNRWALPVWGFLFLGGSVSLWPWFLCVYALTAAVGICCLGRKKFLTLIYAGISPVLSFEEIIRRKDFARWEHTRKHEDV